MRTIHLFHFGNLNSNPEPGIEIIPGFFATLASGRPKNVQFFASGIKTAFVDPTEYHYLLIQYNGSMY